MKKGSVLLLIVSLTFSSTLVLLPVKAQYQGKDITINADGTVSPESAPILRDGSTYTLMSDQAGRITIAKSNITFNGNGHTINQQATFQTNGNAFGIFLSYVYNVTVTNTTIINTGNGIYAIQDPTGAIGVHYGGSNVIIGNNIVNNYNAMNLVETNNNIIAQNNFTNNNNPYVIVSAVMLWGSSNNRIYQNNFIDNNRPAGADSFFNSQSSGNLWDNGKEGNYWDDYNGTDADGDGIGDTPYEIYTRNRSGALYPKNTDRFPLMTPFNSTYYRLKTTPPKITLLSPLNQTYNQTTVSLTFSVDKPVDWIDYSLDGQQNATVIGNSTLNVSQGLHNVTIYANDTFGNIGASETISFNVSIPEPDSEPFPIVPVAAAIVIAVAVAAGLLLTLRKRRKEAQQT